MYMMKSDSWRKVFRMNDESWSGMLKVHDGWNRQMWKAVV